MKFLLPSVLSWLLAIEQTNGFTISPSTIASPTTTFRTQLGLSNNSNEGTTNKKKKKKGQKQQKKRRFAQDVEPIVQFVAPPVPVPAHVQEQPINSVYRKAPTSLKSSGSRTKNMVQSDKSIEELEQIMSKRWGTSGDDWKVDFGEWEISDDDGNEAKDSKHSRKSVSSGRKVRSKPVLDPWEKEERKQEYTKKEKKKFKEDSAKINTNASAFQSAQTRQNSVLDRVKKNQERLQSKKNSKIGDVQPKIDADAPPVPVPVPVQPKINVDFYDEDDEGYESSSSLNTGEEGEDFDEEEDFYNNIISPKPAGGAGSSKSRNSNQGSGFFFSEEPASAPSTPTFKIEESSEETEFKERRAAKQQKEKAKKDARKRMVDDDGKDMFLTLDQAKINAGLVGEGEESNDDEDQPTWEDIGITNPTLLQNLDDMGCNAPLSVQDKACPSIVSGNDVLVSTHTGSGKTLAFLTPLAERLLFDTDNMKSGVKVIIIAPGRELASQIVAVARDLFKGTGLTATLAIGGTPFGRNFEQIRKKKPDFIVGTPGRIAELVVGQPGDKGGKLKIANLQSVVLDECDALLEYEPHRDPTSATMEVLKRRHGRLQSILCSATAGDLLGKSLLDDFLRNGYSHAQSDDSDKLITSGDSKTIRVSRTALHGVVRVDHQRFALETLRKVLYTDPAPQQVLIFVDNARRVGIVVDKLAQLGIIAAPLHGGQGSEKGDRAEVNKALREGFVGIVVATEMAARGIDAPYLTHVINLDLPTDASHYAHRAGRCGRGGRPGVVVNIAVGSREKNVPMKFATALDIDMYLAEPQAGKLAILENNTTEEKKENI